jgi:hypothetical protein
MNNDLSERQKEILAAYELFEDDDISTERLLQMVADYCECEDVGEVVDALWADRNEDDE